MAKNIIHQSLNQSSSKISKEINSDPSNKSILTERKIDTKSRNKNVTARKNRSQQKLYNKNSLYNKYDFENNREPSLHKKNIINLNSNSLSEKNIKNEEEKPDTPVMKLQRNKKPNYLRKSEFIKDKSLTPQEKSFQNSLCPIYDFYKGNSGFNTKKDDNLLKGTSFTQYYNDFKSNNNLHDYFNQVNSPNNNLSEKNNINYYFDFSFIPKKQTGKEYFEQENENKINEISHNKSSGLNNKDSSNNNQIYNIEKKDNFSNTKNEIKNIEVNSPSNIVKELSHSDDFSDEKNIRNENKYYKSPIKYKQMNVNININNNSQNNNIYYQLPNIINNYNNSHNNYFNNNANNNNELSFNNNNNGKTDNFNEHLNRIINSGNNNINLNNNNLSNNNSMSNNNIYNNKEANIGNVFNNRSRNNMQVQANISNSIGNQNLFYQNMNRNKNQIEDKNNKLSRLSQLNQQIENFLNQCSKINNNNNMNNNIKMKDITLNNNYNIDYTNNNFDSITKAYMNNNLNENIYNNNGNLNQMQIFNQNINNNSNGIYNQMNNYYSNNPERIPFQNINNYNPNNQIYNNNNNIYMNNINNIDNNFNQNYYNDSINNSLNYLYQNNNYSLPEFILYKLTPIQLAQNCHIIAKNQNGCRYLQNCIASNPELLKNFFFPKILERINELSNDQFSNYLVKKIFQYLTEEMFLKLIQALKPVIDQIGTNQYGTRVLQDLIDFLNKEKIFLAFINIIIPHVKLLVIDLNGSHIIYKLIQTKNRNIKIIEHIICTQVKDIAITRKGCSFLKKYFDFANENELMKVKQCILKDLKEIITDQYGNYVIQSILMKENSVLIKEFLNEIIKNIVYYSNNKFSSNAVEKCFENETIKNIILDQFLKKDIFEKIIMDKFGNYVVQKAMAKADNKRRNSMLKLLVPLIPNLKSQYFGQRLLSKLILQYPNLNINL